MNVSTKTWLLELLDERWTQAQKRDRGEDVDPRTSLHMELARINDARRLVEQMPEEPTR